MTSSPVPLPAFAGRPSAGPVFRGAEALVPDGPGSRGRSPGKRGRGDGRRVVDGVWSSPVIQRVGVSRLVAGLPGRARQRRGEGWVAGDVFSSGMTGRCVYGDTLPPVVTGRDPVIQRVGASRRVAGLPGRARQRRGGGCVGGVVFSSGVTVRCVYGDTFYPVVTGRDPVIQRAGASCRMAGLPGRARQRRGGGCVAGNVFSSGVTGRCVYGDTLFPVVTGRDPVIQHVGASRRVAGLPGRARQRRGGGCVAGNVFSSGVTVRCVYGYTLFPVVTGQCVYGDTFFPVVTGRCVYGDTFFPVVTGRDPVIQRQVGRGRSAWERPPG